MILVLDKEISGLTMTEQQFQLVEKMDIIALSDYSEMLIKD